MTLTGARPDEATGRSRDAATAPALDAGNAPARGAASAHPSRILGSVRPRRTPGGWWPIATDAALLVVAAVIVHAARFGPDGGSVDLGIDVVDYRVFSAVVVVMWLLAIGAATGRESDLATGAARLRGVLVGTGAAFLATAVAALVLKSEFSRAFVLAVFPLGALLLVLNRLVWAAVVRSQRRRGRMLLRAVVIGSADAGDRLARELADRAEDGVEVVAVATREDPAAGPAAAQDGVVRTGADVADLVERHAASLVVIADVATVSGAFLQDLNWAVERSGARVAVSSRIGLVSPGRFTVLPIGDHPFVAIDFPQFMRGKRTFKRTFDIVVASALLVALGPLLAAITIAVRADSPGGAFFTQTRVGRDGRHFRMLKFRSMVVDAEHQLHRLEHLNEGTGPLFKVRSDPRVTRIGRILRRTSLDELPQLVNVLRGDMSLVGPRPALVREVAEYDERAHRRLIARPGITGLWQVSGRSDLGWEEGLRLDMSYVENWSVVGDLVILVRTIGAVFARRGAY